MLNTKAFLRKLKLFCILMFLSLLFVSAFSAIGEKGKKEGKIIQIPSKEFCKGENIGIFINTSCPGNFSIISENGETKMFEDITIPTSISWTAPDKGVYTLLFTCANYTENRTVVVKECENNITNFTIVLPEFVYCKEGEIRGKIYKNGEPYSGSFVVKIGKDEYSVLSTDGNFSIPLLQEKTSNITLDFFVENTTEEKTIKAVCENESEKENIESESIEVAKSFCENKNVTVKVGCYQNCTLLLVNNKTVLERYEITNTTKLNLGVLPAGNYTLVLLSGDKNVTTSFFVQKANEVKLFLSKRKFYENETVEVNASAIVNCGIFNGTGYLWVVNNETFGPVPIKFVGGVSEKMKINLPPDNYTVCLNVSNFVTKENITVFPIPVKEKIPKINVVLPKEICANESFILVLNASGINCSNASVLIYSGDKLVRNESMHISPQRNQTNLSIKLGKGSYTFFVTACSLNTTGNFVVKECNVTSNVSKNETINEINKGFMCNIIPKFEDTIKLQSNKSKEICFTVSLEECTKNISMYIDGKEYKNFSVISKLNKTLVCSYASLQEGKHMIKVCAYNYCKNFTISVGREEKKEEKTNIILIDFPRNISKCEENIQLAAKVWKEGAPYSGYVNISLPTGVYSVYVENGTLESDLTEILRTLEPGSYKLSISFENVSNASNFLLIPCALRMREISTKFGKIKLLANKGEIENFDYQNGKLFIRIGKLKKGEKVKVKLVLPFEIPPGYHLYFWKKIGNKTIALNYTLENRSTVVFYLKDGILDEDGVENGIVVDPIILPPLPTFIPKVTRISERSFNVTIQEKLGKRFMVISTDKGRIEKLEVVDPESIPVKPKGTNFIYKLFKINITGIKPGESVTLTIRFSQPISSAAEFWKFNAEKLSWKKYPFTRIGNNAIKITLTDGGEGDEDGKANGIIIDDAGLSDSWWNISWKYRIPINITYSGKGNLTEYQINLTIDTQSLILAGKMNGDCSDIRFTYWNETSGSEVKIPYWIEKGCNTTQTVIWVKVPLIRNITYGNETIFMYYGNTTPVQSESNGTATFVYFNYNGNIDFDQYPYGITSNAGTDASAWKSENGYINATMTQSNTHMAAIKNITLDNMHIHYRWNLGSLEDIEEVGFNFRYQDQGNRYYIRFIYYSAAARIRYELMKHVGGVATTIATYDFTPSANTWYTVDVFVNGSSVSVYHDGNLIITDNTLTDFSSGYFGLHQAYTLGTVHYIDDIYVAKYTYPEPVVSIGEEEYVNKLNVSISTPSEGSIVVRYEPFWLNSTVFCVRGNCSLVYAYPQYIATASQYGKLEEDFFNNFSEKVNVTIGSVIKLEPTTLPYAWWNKTWNYRQCFNISSQSEETDYQVKVFFNTSDLGPNFDWNNKEGIRFVWYNATGYNYEEIPYWIAEWNAYSNATFWIRVPELIAGNTTVCMYYGNTTPVKGKSNPKAVFYFYSDGSSLSNFNVQQAGTGGSYAVDSSYGKPAPSFVLSVSGGTASSSTWTILGNTSDILPENYAVEADINITGTSPLIDVLTNFKATGGPFYVFRFDARTGYYDLIGYYGAGATSTTALSTTTITSPTNTWLHMKAVRLNDVLKLYKDDTLEATYNLSGSSYLITGGGIAITTDGATSTDWFDNIIVRKYTEPEPSVVYIYPEENQSYKLSGYYISRVFDLGTNDIDFTNIYWVGETNANTSIKVYTRSSVDGVTWSPWYLEVNNTDVDAPNRRYFQYKVELSTTNPGQTPVFDKIVVSYTYTAPAFIMMQSSSTDFTTSPVPYNCSLLNATNSPCNASWEVTPWEKGNYTLRIWVNSSDTNIKPAQSQWINISVYERTYVTGLSVEPTVQYKGGDVIISARLLDALSNPIPNALINFTDETDGIIIGNATTDSNGYATIIYRIPETASLGYHTIRAEYPQNDTLFYLGSWATAQLKVSSSPKFHEIILSDKYLGTDEKERIQVNVTDEVGLDKVILYLTYPNGTQISAVMNYNLTTGYYEYTTEPLWQAGNYTFYIWANNTDGISNTSWEEYFAVKIIGRLDLGLEKKKYKNFELVKLGNIAEDWSYKNYTYRRVIYVYSRDAETDALVKLNINTSELISEGKLQPNCSDIKFEEKMKIEEVPIAISNPYGVTKYNITFPIIITDKEVLSNMNPTGRDIRIFSYQTDTPYSEEPDIPFWVESVSSSEAKIWVRLSVLPVSGTTLYLYYGNYSADSKSNYTAVFTEIVGEAGIVYANDTWVNFKYINATGETPWVFSSIDSYYGTDQAFTRITKVNQTGFHVFIQESSGLDQTHVYENLAWLAVRNGTWIVAGRIWETGNVTIDNPDGVTYHPLTFNVFLPSSEDFSIFSQVETYNDTTPVKTRMNNPSYSGVSVKLEAGSSTDDPHGYENVAWMAIEIKKNYDEYDAGAHISIGKRYMNQPVAVSTTSGWTEYEIGHFPSTPAIIAKIMTENGGDNCHERIRDVTNSGFEYAIEEEYGLDGVHIYEWNSFIAVEPDKPIYGIRYTTNFPNATLLIGNKRVIKIVSTELPFWIEKGCGTGNTTIWVKIAHLSPGKNTIYMYYDNPYDTSVNNTYEDEVNVFTYTAQYGSYAVLGIQGSDLKVVSYADNNTITLDGGEVILNNREQGTILGTNVILGDLLYSNAPVSSGTTSTGDGAPLTPLAFKGKTFVVGIARYNPVYFDIYALDDARIEVWVNVTGYGGWKLVDNFTLSAGSAVSKSYTGAPDTDVGIENTYLINSTGDIIVFMREDLDDYMPLAPASTELYLVPSNYLELVALENNTNVTIYFSDGTSTSLLLNAGQPWTSAALGSDGLAPAARVVANKPVFAYQIADSDGTEATPGLPRRLMDYYFVFPQDAEYFVVATPAGEVTTCSLYNNSDELVNTWTVTPAGDYPGKIGYGTGQDGTIYVLAGYKLVCNNSVYVYYEEAVNDAETLLYGAKMHAKLNLHNYEIAYEEDKWVNIENNGNETLRGYIWAIVQKWDSASQQWVNIPPAVINDRATGTLRVIPPGGNLNLTELWLSYGAWNTSDFENGTYRVYFAFTDPSGNILYDYESRYLSGESIFEIVPAVLSVGNLTHYSNNFALNEYETGDVIKWINVTVKSLNNSAVYANVNLTLQNSLGGYAGFGPNNENYYCGIIPEGTSCTAVFDNNASGYQIPTSLAITGSANYTFKVVVYAKNGGEYANTSYKITVHNIPSTFSATLSPTRIYQNGAPAYYNFTLTNLWSKNLTNVTVKINCPNLLGLTCECIDNLGSPSCNVSSLAPGKNITFSFRIAATEDTPIGDYIINATVSYINPLNNNKTWVEVKPETLEIRSPGIMEITVYSYPASLTRGENVSFKAYANNTGSLTANESWLAYSLYPAGWRIVSGQQNVTAYNVSPAEIFWNNVTFATNTSSKLGAQTIKLESGSNLGQYDFKYITVYVYGNTTLLIWVNDTNVSRGEGIRIYAKLLLDNGTAIASQNISFYDETENTYIGSALTNVNGIAYVDYAITNTAILGEHIINASFSGNSTIFVNPSQNKTIINVGLKPSINSIQVLPDSVIGYGMNATIRANVTDDQGVDYVEIKITSPSGEVLIANMTKVSQDIYEINYTNTWTNGTYAFTITAHDIVGSITTNSSSFEVKIYGAVVVKTEKDTYYPAENVRLAQAPVYPFLYKRKITIMNPTSENLTEYQVNIFINTSELIVQGKMQSDCDDIRFTWLNETSGEEEKIPYYLDYGCNGNTSIWIKVPFIPANGNATVYMYYGNELAESESNESAVFSYSTPQTTFYVVSFVSANSALDIGAFEDNTTVIFNGNTVLVNKSTPYSFAASGSAASGIAHDKPIYGAFSADVTDAMHPISWAGKRFAYRVYRGTDEWYIYAPFGDAEVNITDSYTGATTTVIVPKGTAYNASVDITDGSTLTGPYSVIIESNVSILVQHAAPAEGYDSRLLYPVSTELYGVPSTIFEVAAIENGTVVNMYCSDGTTYTWNLNRGDTAYVSGFGSEGTAPACVVKANKPVGADQLADSDGTETTTFLPLKELDRVYVFPQGVQYIAVAAPFPNTVCNVYNPDGTLYATGSASPVGEAPGKIYFGSTTDGTNILAGSWMVCNHPVFAYYEYSGTVGGDETNVFGMKANRKYVGVELPYIIGEETHSGSGILNFAHEFKGYVIVEVQKNVSGVWQTVSVLVNDSASNIAREFSTGTFDLRAITPVWNPEGETGEYRMVAYLVNPSQQVLNASKRVMLGEYIFNVIPVPLKLNISEIRVYEAPNNEHGGGTLVKSGINTSFALAIGKTYRFEIQVDVLPESTIWNITEANVTFSNLNSSWFINTSANVWYLNATDTVERVGGIFRNGILKWNTSQNDGIGVNGTSVVFYFIVNLSNATPEERSVKFEIKTPTALFKDYDLIETYYPDTTPPKLWNETYGLNTTEILRGEGALAYARWDEEIGSAVIEYNSTTPLLTNSTITLPVPNPENWTNYSIVTSSLWKLGNHTVRIYASDLAGNWNKTPVMYLGVYGLAYIAGMIINDTTPVVGNWINITCEIKDDTNGEGIASYPVNFYYDGVFIGSASTNASGFATLSYQVNSPGTHVVKCNISASGWYKIDTRNSYEQSIYVNELEPPKWWNVEYPSLAHKGDAIILSVNWTDNFALSGAKLSTNASGTWQNVSELALSGATAWANFSYQIPVTMETGYLAWKQYANDTSGNENVTSEFTVEVWGWAKVQSAFVQPSSIELGNSTTMYCKIVDANNTVYAIQGYNVSFWLGNTYLGSNLTNSSGWAQLTFAPSQAGTFTVKCNISDYVAGKYNASELNTGSDYLTVTTTADITPPKLVNETYGLNATSIYRYDSVLVYAQWNEAIDKAWVEYNVSLPTAFTIVYFNSSGTPGNWTNYTITTDDLWKPGVHAVKLYANDTSGNINDTLPYLTFEMWGRSAVYWVEPTTSVYRGRVTLKCAVKDYDTGEAIPDYIVEFYNSTSYLGSNTTDANGYAQLTIDTSFYTPGSHTFYCKIVDDTAKYYAAVVTQASYTFDILGKLNVTIILPANASILERTLTYELNSTTVDEFGNPVTPTTANWYDNGVSIGSGENITWTVPSTHALGVTVIKVNVTKAYYDPSEDNVTVFIYGHSGAVWITPNDGSYPQGKLLTLTCFVNDTDAGGGIGSYPVSFYYNGTLIASTSTNSSGYASVSWNTSGLVGIFNVSCVIKDEPALYYYAAQPLANTFIELYNDTQAPNVTIILPENTTYASSNITLNYTVSDDYFIDKCWYSLDNGPNTTLPSCTNTTLTSLADGTHRVIVYANDSAGNVGYAEQYFTVDTQAPVITIVSPKNETYPTAWAWINVSTNEVSTCWYSLDNGANTSMQQLNATYWYANSSTLSEGAHNVVVYCNDSAGNENVSSTVFTIDITPPETYLIEPVDNAVLNTDYITFNCNASDNIRVVNVSLLTNESGVLSIVQTNSSGVTGNYTFSRSVYDGVYLWTCEVCDAVRCVLAPENRTVIADTQAPNVTIILPENTSYATSDIPLNYSVQDISLDSCWYSLDNGPNISLPNCANTTLTSLADGTHRVIVYANDSLGRTSYDVEHFTVDTTPPEVNVISPVNNTLYGVNVINLNYTVSDNIAITWCGYSLDGGANVTLPNCTNTTLTALTNGVHNVTVYVRDIAGNENKSFVNFTVNSVAPVVSIIIPEDYAYYAKSNVSLNYTAKDTDLDSCWYSLDNGPNISLPNCANTTLTNLADGTHRVIVYANDSQGHESYDDTIFYIDTQAPNVTIILPENTTYSSSSVKLNYTVSDANLVACWYSLDNGPNISLPNCANTTLTNLADGTHRVIVYANDSAGNVGYAEQYFTVDTQAPVITIVSPENITYLQSDIDVNYTVNDNFAIDMCWYVLDAGEIVYLLSCQNITLTNLVDGAHTLTIYANDTAGNVNSSSVTFTIDTLGPEITFVPPTPYDNEALDQNWTYINITTNEPVSVAFLEWNFTNGTVVNFTMNALTNTSLWYNVTNLADGTYYYRVHANDSYNHWSTTSWRAVRISTTAPVIDIISPLPTTYTESNYIALNVSANKPIDKWWFSINGKPNETFTPNTSIAASIGSNTLYVYANDTSGRVGWSSVTFYVNTTKWEDYFATGSGINETENTSINGKLAIDFCWYVDGECFNYRKKLYIESISPENETQVNLTIDTQSLILAGKMNGDCSDIRFTWLNETTGKEVKIPYYIESGCNTTQTVIWIKVPALGIGNNTVYMYYGNSLAQSESNDKEVFEYYNASYTCSGSVAGGICEINITAPNGTLFYNATLDLEAAGDFGYGGVYASELCDIGEVYERFNITVEGVCKGGYSPGIDGCVLTHISTWPKDVSQEARNKARINVVFHANSKVNSDPATCGFYYSYRVNVTALVRNNFTAAAIYDLGEETRIHNAYAKSILITPLKVSRWDKLCAVYNLNGNSLEIDVYNSTGKLLYNCTNEIIAGGCCNISNVTEKSIYLLYKLFTNRSFASPEIYMINVTWNTSSMVRFETYNESWLQRNDTYARIYDSRGNIVAEGYTPLSANLEIYNNYTYESITPVSGGNLIVKIFNLNITSPSTSIQEQIVENYSGYLPSNVSAITTIYALNDSELQFGKAELIIPKNGINVNYILHCTDWNFTSANCSSWEFINPSTLEGYGENATHIWFNVSTFEGYGGVAGGIDLSVKNISFNVSQDRAIEGEPIKIMARIEETIGFTVNNVNVTFNAYFYNGTEWILKETQSQLINVPGNSYNISNFTWIAKPGTWNFTIIINYTDQNVTNNENSTTYNVSGWTVYYGFTNGWLAIKDAEGRNFSVWIPLIQQGNLYFADADSSFEFDNLMPLNGTNDLAEADKALNMTGFSDSIEKLFDKNGDGIPDATACFEIGYRLVCGVPIINSTENNSGNFVTGILWDAGDGGTEYNGTQDLVFVTKINAGAQGAFGTYDYEIRVPALLRKLKGTTDLVKVYFEVK